MALIQPTDVLFWAGFFTGFVGGIAICLACIYSWRQSRIRKMSDAGRRMHR